MRKRTIYVAIHAYKHFVYANIDAEWRLMSNLIVCKTTFLTTSAGTKAKTY